MNAHEAIRELRRPPTVAAVRWKIQAGGGTKESPGAAQVVTYIDSRYAADRLNQVLGLSWSDAYELIYDQTLGAMIGVECAITIETDGQQVTRRDIGWFGGDKPEMRGKGLYSDAFKRASVKLGIGAVLYTVPMSWLDGSKGEIRYGGKLGKPVGFTPAGQKKLDGIYAQHLANVEAIFGSPLDHGDAAGAQGDIEVGDNAVDDTPPPASTNGVPPEALRSDVAALLVVKEGKTPEEAAAWVEAHVAKAADPASYLQRARDQLEAKPDRAVA